jgi:hypothetical protein
MRRRHTGLRTERQSTRGGNTHTDRTRIHTHTHTHTQNKRTTITRSVVEREIVGSRRFRGCLLVPQSREREAIMQTVGYEAYDEKILSMNLWIAIVLS